MDDLRNAARQQTPRGGRIILPRSAASIDCAVWNLSENGACLVVDKQNAVPERFELILSADLSVRSCEVAWRSANQIGVSFPARCSEQGSRATKPRAEKRTEFTLGISGFVEETGSAEPLPCRVLDLSASGAKLDLPGAVPLGESFNLKLSKRGEPRLCKVVWRDGGLVGVLFQSK